MCTEIEIHPKGVVVHLIQDSTGTLVGSDHWKWFGGPFLIFTERTGEEGISEVLTRAHAERGCSPNFFSTD